jgi:hypothetical protein
MHRQAHEFAEGCGAADRPDGPGGLLGALLDQDLSPGALDGPGLVVIGMKLSSAPAPGRE